MEPAVLLMDEPLSNLDALLRLTFRAELKKLVSELGTTAIYVTHDHSLELPAGVAAGPHAGGRAARLAPAADRLHRGAGAQGGGAGGLPGPSQPGPVAPAG